MLVCVCLKVTLNSFLNSFLADAMILFALSCKIYPTYAYNNDIFLSFFPFAFIKLTGRRASKSLYLEFFKHPLQLFSACIGPCLQGKSL